jgi:hypothetical protein
LKDKKGLTVEEVGFLVSAQLRAGMSKALNQVPPSFVGKTVGQVIDEERKLQADARTKQAEDDRLAAEAKAKEEALYVELRKSVNFTVFEKFFRASNPYQGEYDDYIVLKCAYENTSGKDIRAFRGSVLFTDLFGAEIFETSITISDAIKAGEKANWTGTLDYNRFREEHQRLRNARLEDMKVVWRPKSVIFGDGTQLGEPPTER